MRDLLIARMHDAERLLQNLIRDDEALQALEGTISAVADCFRQRGRVLSCGNGGSMADAMHFAEEWTGRFQSDRKPYPALALSDPTHMSCTANDYGFEHVFARQVEAFGHAGDVLLLLSTSGNSENLVRAAEVARRNLLTVVGFLGRGGGEVKQHCHICFMAPGDTSDRIQELHMMALHIVIEAVERELGH